MSARPTVTVNLLWLVPGVVGGSEEYTTRLLAGVAERPPPDFDVTLAALRPFGDTYPDLAAALPTQLLPLDGRFKTLRVGAESTWLAWQTRRSTLVHHAGGTMPPVRTQPGVVTIHDLQPLIHPARFSSRKQLYLRSRLGPSVRKAKVVITLTEATKQTIVNRLHIHPDRVAIVPPGIGIEAAGDNRPHPLARTSFELDGPYFLYPAITYPHKNHLTLLDAFARVVAQRPDALLVLTSGGADAEEAVVARIRELGLDGSVRRLGRVAAADLEWLYESAVAVTFPSSFEGFGMPVLEAMAKGCPVISSNVTALPEVVGDAGILLPPDDAEAWASAMLRLLGDDGERARLRDAGLRRAAQFTWPAATERLLQVYRDVLDRLDHAS